VDYEGGRSEADFVNFLNEKCGTQRAVGGGLTDKVRRALIMGFGLLKPPTFRPAVCQRLTPSRTSSS
jgi:hypothetical protein